jgi:hypothetical protein
LRQKNDGGFGTRLSDLAGGFNSVEAWHSNVEQHHIRTQYRRFLDRLWLLKNSFSEKCSKNLCATMPYKRRSQFSGHFLSPDFGAFQAKQDFFNSHAC